MDGTHVSFDPGGRPGETVWPAVLWFYERDNVALRLETRYDNTTGEYLAVLHHPDGRREVQRFSQLEAFRQWLLTLEQKLVAERWDPEGIARHFARWVAR